MAKTTKADEFLRAMQEAPENLPQPADPAIPAIDQAERATPAKPSRRVGLKHFGGYLDDETIEKIALLRARLKKDNSELIKLAIDDLHRKHLAKRAFGDAT